MYTDGQNHCVNKGCPVNFLYVELIGDEVTYFTPAQKETTLHALETLDANHEIKACMTRSQAEEEEITEPVADSCITAQRIGLLLGAMTYSRASEDHHKIKRIRQLGLPG